jgi:hypothetical protein
MPKQKATPEAPGPSRKTQPRSSKTSKAQKEENTTPSLSLADFPSVHGGVTYTPAFSAPAAPTHKPTREDYLKHLRMTGTDLPVNLFPKAPKSEPMDVVVDPDEQLKKRYLKMSNVERVRTPKELDREYNKLEKEAGYKDAELKKRFKKLSGIGKKNTKAKKQKEPKSEDSLQSEYQRVFGKEARDLRSPRNSGLQRAKYTGTPLTGPTANIPSFMIHNSALMHGVPNPSKTRHIPSFMIHNKNPLVGLGGLSKKK